MSRRTDRKAGQGAMDRKTSRNLGRVARPLLASFVAVFAFSCARQPTPSPTLAVPVLTPTIPPPTPTPSIAPTQTRAPSPAPTITGSMPVSPGAGIAPVNVAQLVSLAEVPVEGGQLAWSPDGTLLAIGTRASVVLLAPLSEAEARVFAAPDGWENPSPCFGAVAFSADGTQVAGGFTVIVPVWDVASGDLVHEHHNVSGEVTSVAFSPDGKWIAASGMRGGFVSPSTTTVPSLWIDSAPEVTWSVAFNPVAEMLASSGPSIDLWDLATGELFREIPGSGFQLAFSPDGTMLADGMSLWDPATGDLLRRLELPEGAHQLSLAFDPSGAILALGFDDGSVAFYDPGTGAVLHAIGAHSGPVLGLAFSPDGHLLASTGSDALLRIWGIPTGP